MINRYRIIVLMLICCLFGFFGHLSAQDQLGKISCICIDAGHGGKDPGAINGKIKEKDITLAIALKLGSLIHKNYPDMKIVYTRKKDVAVDLRERGKIANKEKAQLFISVHVNKFKNPTVRGVETYVLGLHKSEASLQVAMKENEAIHYEEDYTVKYDGFDPQKTESYIMFNFMKNSYLINSIELATPVQQELVKSLGSVNREVRQAGFIVLMDVGMPAILVETGFISNAKDLQYLTSESGQQKIAQAIFNAFREYKNKMEKNSIVLKGEPKSVSPDGEWFYAVQVLSSATKVTDLKRLHLKDNIEEIHSDGRYKYYVGKSSSYEEILKVQKRLRKSVKDCFVIAISNGRVVPLSEVKKWEKK